MMMDISALRSGGEFEDFFFRYFFFRNDKERVDQPDAQLCNVQREKARRDAKEPLYSCNSGRC